MINAFVHNDFTNDVPPKFVIFPDRIEIPSAGGLPEGLNEDELFEGFSVPGNKKRMRVFKSPGMAEQPGSGVQVILKSSGRNALSFSITSREGPFRHNEMLPFRLSVKLRN